MAKDHIFDILQKELEGKSLSPKAEEIGRVVSVGDGVVLIEGLPNVMFSEMVEITRWPEEENQKSIPALVLNQ